MQISSHPRGLDSPLWLFFFSSGKLQGIDYFPLRSPINNIKYQEQNCILTICLLKCKFHL